MLGEAAARGAAENVIVNLPAIGDEAYAGEMVGGERHLHDDPATDGSSLRARIASRTPAGRLPRSRRAAPRSRPSRTPEDLPEIDSRRGVAPKDHDRESRALAMGPVVRDVLDGGADLRCDRSAEEESRAARGTVRPSRPERLAGLAAGRRLVAGRRELLDVVDDPLHAHRLLGHVVSSSTDGRFTRTFAPAPPAAASPSSAATPRSLDALTLLRPASVSAADTTERHASSVAMGTSARPSRGRADGSASGRLLGVGLAGQLHRGGERRVRRGVLVGESSRRAARSRAGRGGSRVEVRVLAYFSRPWESAATIATRAAPSEAATAEALPPPGTGSADASRRRTRRPSGPGSDMGCPARAWPDCRWRSGRRMGRRSRCGASGRSPGTAVGERGTGAPAPAGPTRGAPRRASPDGRCARARQAAATLARRAP